MLVTPAVKVATVLRLLAPLGFLPLASPIVVAAVPLLLERMLATGYPTWWTSTYHYDAFIVMVMVLAAVDGAARIQRRLRRRWPERDIEPPAARPAPRASWRAVSPATAWAAAVCVAAVAALPWTPLGQLVHPRFYTVNARIRAAEVGPARIPILALTANSSREDHEECLAAGMDGHLSKPFDRQDLDEAIEKLALRRPAA